MDGGVVVAEEAEGEEGVSVSMSTSKSEADACQARLEGLREAAENEVSRCSLSVLWIDKYCWYCC